MEDGDRKEVILIGRVVEILDSRLVKSWKLVKRRKQLLSSTLKIFRGNLESGDQVVSSSYGMEWVSGSKYLPVNLHHQRRSTQVPKRAYILPEP